MGPDEAESDRFESFSGEVEELMVSRLVDMRTSVNGTEFLSEFPRHFWPALARFTMRVPVRADTQAMLPIVELESFHDVRVDDSDKSRLRAAMAVTYFALSRPCVPQKSKADKRVAGFARLSRTMVGYAVDGYLGLLR